MIILGWIEFKKHFSAMPVPYLYSDFLSDYNDFVNKRTNDSIPSFFKSRYSDIEEASWKEQVFTVSLRRMNAIKNDPAITLLIEHHCKHSSDRVLDSVMRAIHYLVTEPRHDLPSGELNKEPLIEDIIEFSSNFLL
jgi:hypothetical protein